MDGLYKEAFIKSVDEPYLRPISDEGIGFYNMDINTAVLTFQVLKNDFPLEISSVNTVTYAYFISENGSSTGRVKVEYVKPMDGIIRLTLDNDFLKAATDTYVTGQIYITAVGRKDTVVLNEFRFRVKDALINQIDSDIKIRYIREIDDLVDDFKEKIAIVSKNFESIENAQAEFTAFVNGLKNNFIKQVNDLKQEMNSFSDKTQQDITDRLNVIDTKLLEATDKLNIKTEGLVNNDQLIRELSNYVTNKQFTDELGKKANTSDLTAISSGLDKLIQEKVDTSIAKIAMQQFALTDKDGYIPKIENPDLEKMSKIDKSGLYYLYNPINSPDPDNQSGYAFVLARSSTYKKILFMPYNKHKIYSRNMMGTATGWGSWYDATSNIMLK